MKKIGAASKAINKYLQQYAEPEAKQCADLPGGYQHVLLIPVKSEPLKFATGLQEFAATQHSCLFIININQAEETLPCPLNTSLHRHLLSSGAIIWHNNANHLIQWDNGNNLLLVDCFEHGRLIPSDQGVGLARKIAADIAVQLFQQGVIKNNWIFSSDADVSLPEDYFCLDGSENKTAAAATIPFSHISNTDPSIGSEKRQEIFLATQAYEKSLHYYFNGLQWAGSDYAFYTIGSALAFRAEAYCQVRGFPCRSAAEDFYLLNKLAKVGAVIVAPCDTIKIEARLSSRVPFGTGPAVKSLLENPQALTPQSSSTPDYDFEYYDPRCFVSLKATLEQMVQGPCQFDALSETNQNALTSLGWAKLKAHCDKQGLAEPNNIEQWKKQWHTWFDGFKTLKFVHYMRDTRHHNISLHEATQKLAALQNPTA